MRDKDTKALEMLVEEVYDNKIQIFKKLDKIPETYRKDEDNGYDITKRAELDPDNAYDNQFYKHVRQMIEKEYGTKFRFLERGERIREGDRFITDEGGESFPATDVGNGIMSDNHYPHLRPIR